jgi:AAA domain
MMYSPDKYPRRIGNIGSPLPDPLLSLAAQRIQFRRGATSMIAGTPGSCKSVLALNMLAQWSKDRIGCLYFSADSEEFTVVRRLAGILTGDDLDTVEKKMLRGEHGRYVAALRRTDVVQFEYEQLDMQGIANRVKAYEQVYGSYPEVVFVDNLINFVESPDDWGGMLILTRELDALARDTRSHIVILHHAKLRPTVAGRTPAFDKPPADHEIQGKVTQIPRLVLTIGADNLSVRVACVKNTNGPQWKDASVYWDFALTNSMRLQELSFAMGRI